MKIGIIVGTRPEIIKMAPVIRECQKRGVPFFIIHSNQHYSEDMDSIFFNDLELPNPDYNLGVGSGQHGNQTGNILIKIEPILSSEKPDVVLVQGDTNTVLAGALAASKLDINVGHIEAGLRSYDRMMPEETNRTLTDHMSEYLFAVGPNQEAILLNEGIFKENIHVVGNTVSDSLFQHLDIAADKSEILTELELEQKSYFLVTAHRASNVDIKSHLLELLHLFDDLHSQFSQPIVWPIHPRTEAKLAAFDIQLPQYIMRVPPIGYLDFIQLQKNARLILTDSGGIQEEACLLGVPCITLRENTERPESIEVGANVLVGRSSGKAIAAADNWLSSDNLSWDNPFGDGHVAERILDIVTGVDARAPVENITAKNESIAVIGMGYMGLPIACLLANAGYSVTGVDIDHDKVAQINSADCPFDESGLPELLSKVVNQGFLKAATEAPSSDTYLIAVPTPQKNNACDPTYVHAAVGSIAKVAKNRETVIIESTISPRTGLDVTTRFKTLGLDIDVAYCPERAIPGQTLHELINNDRIVGAQNANVQQKVKAIYQSFVKGEVNLTDLVTAECVKLVENTSRDVGIAFANELADICQELDVDVFDVISLANRHPRVNVLNPGPGVGGHCIPIDPWFLVENTKSGDLVRLARSINDQRPIDVAERVIELTKKHGGKNVGILGVAYKANVDDCRETPAKPIAASLERANLAIKYHDPFVSNWCCERANEISDLFDWADTLVLVTDHDCYREMKIDLPFVDTRGMMRS